MGHFPWEENVQRIGAMVVYIIKTDNIGQDLECFQFIQVQKFRTLGLRSLTQTKSNDSCSEARKQSPKLNKTRCSVIFFFCYLLSLSKNKCWRDLQLNVKMTVSKGFSNTAEKNFRGTGGRRLSSPIPLSSKVQDWSSEGDEFLKQISSERGRLSLSWRMEPFLEDNLQCSAEE